MPHRHNRRVLEAALVAEPDDRAAHAAYADLLIEAGDSRGEFIQAQFRLEDSGLGPDERAALRRREQYLLAEYRREWLCDLAPYFLDAEEPCSFTFRRGWLDTLIIPTLTVNFARVLREAPQTRLLRRLINIDSESEFAGEDYAPGDDVPNDDAFPSLHVLRGAPYLTNVRSLQLGDRLAFEADAHVGHGTGDALVELLGSMPRIEEVVTHAYSLNAQSLFGYPFADLRVLEVSRGFTYDLAALEENRSLGNLRRLVLQPAGIREETHQALALPGLERLFRSTHFPALKELAVRADNQGDAICLILAASKMIRRLEWLDLSGNAITDAGAAVLARNRDLRHLPKLVLHRNRLTTAGIECLRAVNRNVDFGSQRGPAK